MHRTFAVFALILTTACAGSTSFLDEDARVDLGPGTNAEVILEFEAVGSHAGDFDFTVNVTLGEGITAAVTPQTATVDGVIELTVDLEMDANAENPFGSGSVFVEGMNDNSGAGTTISIDIPTTAR